MGRIERGALTHTPLCVAQTACGRLPRGTGAQPGAVATRGVEGLVREGGSRRSGGTMLTADASCCMAETNIPL